MDYFVSKNSIVRTIWGKSDTILFIFAGASAEFALSKAVDWLYFTGRLPHDPLGRLFSTVSYARAIVFSEEQEAYRVIDAMAAVHNKVEMKRGTSIPDWAYRDVLFMLIDYSIRSFELLERKLSKPEKHEVFHVFTKLGVRMGIKNLPTDFNAWQQSRYEHMLQNLQYSHYSKDLFMQYKKHLGAIRYLILIEAQKMVIPKQVRKLLGAGQISILYPLLAIYKICKHIKLDTIIKSVILPKEYQMEISHLDNNGTVR
jgi:hypothetical protein